MYLLSNRLTYANTSQLQIILCYQVITLSGPRYIVSEEDFTEIYNSACPAPFTYGIIGYTRGDYFILDTPRSYSHYRETACEFLELHYDEQPVTEEAIQEFIISFSTARSLPALVTKYNGFYD